MLLDKPLPTGVKLYFEVTNQLLIQFLHRVQPQKYLGSKQGDHHLLELGHTLFLLNRIHFLSQKKLPTYFTAFKSLNLVELAGPSPQLALSMASAVPIFGILGLGGTAETLIQQSLTVANSLPKSQKFATLARCCLPIAYFKISIEQYVQSDEVINQCIQICHNLGDSRLLEECYAVKIHCLEYTGKFQQSMKLATEMLQSARSRGDQNMSEWATIISVNSLLAAEKVDEAIKVRPLLVLFHLTS